MEVTYRTRDIVNKVQMQELSDLINMLDDAIEDRQKNYYIVIDKLDENWVDENLKNRLVRALIDTVKDFVPVGQVKILVVLRVDLVQRVLRLTSDKSFQEEKYTTLFLRVRWSRKKLIELLNKRIDFLVKQRYTSKKVTYSDLLPARIGGPEGVESIDYMINRTLMRPRDLI